jgi:hypothetical protein
MKHLNPSFNRFYAIIVSAALVILGAYLPIMGLSASAYVGNKTMMNFGSYIITLLSLYFVTHGLWLIFFIRGFAFVKGGDKDWSKWLYNLRHTFEYKLTLWVWVALASLTFALIGSVWIYLIAASGVGFTGEFKLSSADLFIGATGTFLHNDDLFQVTALVTTILTGLATFFFVKLNAMLLFFGTQNP